MEDMADLQCLPPTHEPRVSTHMDQIKQMIATIIDNGYAYEVEGDVYFSVDKISDYGRLSGQKVLHNQPGKRVAIDPRKKNPADFALWKANMDYHPLVVRYFLMRAHYRSHMDYMKEQLEIASSRFITSIRFILVVDHTKLLILCFDFQTLHDSEKVLSPYRRENVEEESSNSAKAQNQVSHLRKDFETKMSDDLHTPEFLKSGLQDALRFINNTLDMVKKKKPQPSVFQSLDALESEIKELLKNLVLLWPLSYLKVLESLKEKALKRANIKLDYVLQKIEERVEARKHRDYLKADEIRRDLASKGIIFMNEGEKTVWRPMRPSNSSIGELIAFNKST
ncbi:hypothetical protein GIB67_001835 [Kingdonia uniflora]|uniref:tRNA synthetases class I catalytic domain-containing protein n=1 Tax=Kingdonia uniflora TaxID=39325 RepID=A0A7J7LC47_9MAGN|nr:hypothetical protein GIB67_001835 [Kingdonia uniflora]